jgi:alkanesulfonate monooxygenase SsuD/methylene tetrahydromethanopterin reductase-like flavin-dependent oxidoreductase (luciferase family)
VRIGMMLSYSGGFTEAVAELADHERAGLGIVWVPEAYSFDAVSQLGYLAARTSRVEIAAGVLQIYTRTPTLTAMTAAGLDFVSGGRFTLGLGASNPQVVEGFHGVRYDAPVARTREIVEICRAVWRRERVEHDGGHYRIPLPPEEGTGLGKPLRLINHPVRERIPIVLAPWGRATSRWPPRSPRAGCRSCTCRSGRVCCGGPRSTRAGPGATPSSAPSTWWPRRPCASPTTRTARGRPSTTSGPSWRSTRAAWARAVATSTTTSSAATAGRRGPADPGPLPGRQEGGGGRAVPTEMLDAMALVGPRGHVAERLAAFAAAGVTTLNVTPLGGSPTERVAQVATVVELAAGA